jgi:hypothetical protein
VSFVAIRSSVVLGVLAALNRILASEEPAQPWAGVSAQVTGFRAWRVAPPG